MTHPRPRLSLLALGVAAALVLVQACGSDTAPEDGAGGDGSSTHGSNAPASCDDVCARSAELCGALPPGCASACSGWSVGLRACVMEASDCAALDSCADATSGSGGAASSSSSGGNDPGVPCDPYQSGAAATHACAEGCSTAQAEDMKSIWCLKYCDSDSDCACSGSGCGAVSKCVPSAELGNPTVCVPGCFSDADCRAEGWGTCQTLTGNYCSGGPHYTY